MRRPVPIKHPVPFQLAALLVCAAAAIAQAPAPDLHATVSPHRRGPHGLAGWTLNEPYPDRPGEVYPRTLVLSRHGRIIRRITGESYLWKWLFWADGTQVAYQDGPPHFVLRCILVDLKTGHQLANEDCFSDLPASAPAWEQQLVK